MFVSVTVNRVFVLALAIGVPVRVHYDDVISIMWASMLVLHRTWMCMATAVLNR